MIINFHHNHQLSPQQALLEWANVVDELLMYEPVTESEMRLYNYIRDALLLIYRGRSLIHWADCMKSVTAQPAKTISERLLYEVIGTAISLVEKISELDCATETVAAAVPEKELPHERKIQPNLN